MALSPKLDFRQSQSLAMTPQLMQSIKLLQMTHIELTRFLEQEIEKNPLLEREERSDGESADLERSGEEDAGENAEAVDPASDEDWFKTGAVDDAQSLSSAFDASLENIFPDDPGRSDRQFRDSPGAVSNPGYDDIGEITVSRPSLSEYVAEQVALTFRAPADRFIASALADALDENGYLRADIYMLAQNLGVETAHVEHILEKMQGFDPAGIFARDLRECLAIQLHLRDRLDPAMAAMIDHLDLLARRDFAALKKVCGVDQADIADMLREIRALDPKPGARFSVDIADSVVPDVLVGLTRQGDWAIELNSAALPRLIVNNQYYARVSRSVKAEEKAFLSDCMQTANWLVRSLDQRARTILKVTQEIVRQQDGFLRRGVIHLKPLNMRAIADAVGMHESTISRVSAGKFMATPRGMFELRYFFNASIASSEGGSAHSSESVRHRIRQMIDAENPANVLSDDAIVDALKKDGVDIARRTVAKYRESMNIASSVQRRREKRAEASRHF
ncbi:RNA polymerase sigma-54 factor [Falsochrobactrum shanghaiense]|uniref:RNA polymerase sigma-54 factor n=1 Tax=Falsochrobactrum shanghaiense TaxID=2201899 RepID=A0A316JD25_9HYPH|nr:RNA polymerase factor sigma-54 [Falsochrobactrum shanghaiense]PWL19326.1 RNA polymerase sigma-54 factor [Falsochrobactrum shanghaiense]